MSLPMQSKKLPILGAVLVVQIIIAAVLLMNSSDQVTAINQPLLVFDREAVDKIYLEGKEGEPLTLVKEGDNWTMADGLPVLPMRLDSIFDDLASLKTQWPVANTEKAAERFAVQDDNFVHKVTLYSGENKIGPVLIGSSPSFNKSHIRLPDEEDIYALRINAYDTTNNKDYWLESTLLQPQGEFESVISDSYSLTKQDGQWPEIEQDDMDKSKAAEGSEDADNEPLNIVKFEEVLSTLRVIGVADSIAALDAKESDSSTDDGNSMNVIAWTVKTDSGEYKYKMLKKEDQFYLRRDDYPQTFRISKYQYDNFSKISKKSISVAKN